MHNKSKREKKMLLGRARVMSVMGDGEWRRRESSYWYQIVRCAPVRFLPSESRIRHKIQWITAIETEWESHILTWTLGAILLFSCVWLTRNYCTSIEANAVVRNTKRLKKIYKHIKLMSNLESESLLHVCSRNWMLGSNQVAFANYSIDPVQITKSTVHILLII